MFYQGRMQQGMVLVISLLLLLVLSMVAVTAMESSQFAYKMSSNRVFYEEAFNHSESARKAGILALQNYLNDADVSDESLPSGIRFDQQSEEVDGLNLHYQASGISGDIYISKGLTIPNSVGFGSAQYQGYRGAGVGAGTAGSLVKLYEVRSAGFASGSSAAKNGKREIQVWTASDYRYVR